MRPVVPVAPPAAADAKRPEQPSSHSDDAGVAGAAVTPSSSPSPPSSSPASSSAAAPGAADASASATNSTSAAGSSDTWAERALLPLPTGGGHVLLFRLVNEYAYSADSPFGFGDEMLESAPLAGSSEDRADQVEPIDSIGRFRGLPGYD